MNKRYRKFKIVTIIVFVMIAGIIIGNKRGIPFIVSKGEYSIGIFVSEKNNPFKLYQNIKNPVITAKMVKDVKADFVADPFLVLENGEWFMFFEIFNIESQQGDIGLAISNDGMNWEYKKIVLDEKSHLSFPIVFKHENEYFMIPESREMYEIRLYKAELFPDKWVFKSKLISGNFSDPSIFRHNDVWWIFTSDRNDYLHLFYSDSLEGKWVEHPESPIVKSDFIRARSAGRVFKYNDTLFRFSQDCKDGYGNSVHVFKIKEISKIIYSEIESNDSPILKGSGKGWNSLQMHHIDIEEFNQNQYLIATDGRKKNIRLGLKY
jgi:hypothetical protein